MYLLIKRVVSEMDSIAAIEYSKGSGSVPDVDDLRLSPEAVEALLYGWSWLAPRVGEF